MVVIMATGCQLGPRDFTNENDALRQQVLQLKRRVGDLEKDLAFKSDQVHTLAQRVDQKPQLPSVAPADLPQLTQVRFDRYTGAYDTDQDSRDDTLRLYVRTLDQQGRFLPVAAAAVVQAVLIQPGVPPRVLVEQAFDPPAFNQAFRSGLTGTHFTLESALPTPLPEGVEQLTVKLTLTDAATGHTLTHEQPVSIRTQPDTPSD